MEEKLATLLEYRKHLSDQYSDRAALWALQEAAVDEMADLLVCQIDGMDQAKFRIPRDPQLRSSASLPLDFSNSIFFWRQISHWIKVSIQASFCWLWNKLPSAFECDCHQGHHMCGPRWRCMGFGFLVPLMEFIKCHIIVCDLCGFLCFPP